MMGWYLLELQLYIVMLILLKIHCMQHWKVVGVVCEIGIINPLIVTEQSPSDCCVI